MAEPTTAEPPNPETTTTATTTSSSTSSIPILDPAPLLTLFRGFPARLCYIASPFVTKLELRLRMARIFYMVGTGSPFQGPRGKVPYIRLEQSGEYLSDSTLITQDFIDKGYMIDLNAWLTGTEKAIDVAVRALLEEKLYFYLVRERWCDNYETMYNDVLSPVPWPFRTFIGRYIYYRATSTLYGQGTLRYTKDEIEALRHEVWGSINTLLVVSRSRAMALVAGVEDRAVADQPFWILGGVGPTEADPTVFGFIAASLVCEAGPDTARIIRSYPVIMEYARKIHDKYFSDYERWDD